MLQTKSADSESSAFVRVRALITSKRCEAALVELSTIVRERPRSAEAWALVAQALSLKCQYPHALLAAQQALDLDPNHLWAHELRTGLLLQLDRRDEALFSAENLVAMSPNRPESHAFLAFAHAFNGNEPAALGSARKSRQLAPHKSIGNQAFCVVNLSFNRWKRAEDAALAALEVERNVASLHHDLGIAQLEQGKLKEAKRSFATAALLDSRFAGIAERMTTQTPNGVSPIPVFVAMAAGIAAIPLGMMTWDLTTMTWAFVAVIVIGVLSLLAAARRTGKSRSLHAASLRPALAVVLCCDIAVALKQLGLF